MGEWHLRGMGVKSPHSTSLSNGPTLRHGFKKTKNLVGAYKRRSSAQSIRFFIAKNMRQKRGGS